VEIISFGNSAECLHPKICEIRFRREADEFLRRFSIGVFTVQSYSCSDFEGLAAHLNLLFSGSMRYILNIVHECSIYILEYGSLQIRIRFPSLSLDMRSLSISG